MKFENANARRIYPPDFEPHSTSKTVSSFLTVLPMTVDTLDLLKDLMVALAADLQSINFLPVRIVKVNKEKKTSILIYIAISRNCSSKILERETHLLYLRIQILYHLPFLLQHDL